MATSVFVGATDNAEIDGLLGGTKWTGTITYSFPDSPSDYVSPYSNKAEPTSSGFAQAPSQMQAATTYAVGLINSYTNANIQYAGTNGADIMVAQSPKANPTSYAYYPSGNATGGDVWFGTAYNYSLASSGNYYFATALHEFGHAVGLKHSQETGGVAGVAVPAAHDDSEYTVMSYRSYVGAPLSGYTAESYGYPQTYMANDILALQTLYGANYTTQSGNTVYTWSPTTGQQFINGVGQLAPGGGIGGSANRILETVWDGGGIDTYDLSNYTTNLTLDLNPGAASVFSAVQIANLGDGHYASGNVYNAYLYNNDARSYIDNAIGGTGNDTIIGNAIANALTGGGGDDTFTGGGGNDTIVGGSGTDKAVYSGATANYSISYNAATQVFTVVDQRAGSPDGTDSVSGVESFQFADGTVLAAAIVNPPSTVEAAGSTSLVTAGGNYFLGTSGPVLKVNGAAVTAATYPGWLPAGVEAIAGGFEVAMKNGSQFSIWYTDSAGNFVSNQTGVVAGNSATLISFETSFHQDLNGDGVTGSAGPPGSTTIESAGATSLVQSGSNFYFGSTAGPVLKINGAAVTSATYPGWLPVGVEAIAGGFEVAMKNGSQFSIWYTDSAGNFTSNQTGIVDGSSATLKSFETSFNQDLNGDGTIGSPSFVTIESAGATSLVQSGGNFYFGSTGGPMLKINGAAVTAATYPGWLPAGVEAIAGGFEVAMKNGTQFSIWYTDSNGNFTSNQTGIVAGNSATLMSFENSFHQDLNGDGVTGPAGPSSTTIESSGVTSLVQSGGNFFFGSTAGPMLKINGAAVTAATYPGWLPAAVEPTATGYEVAMKNGTQFSIWYTDSNGNFVSNQTGVVAGSSATLQSFEPSFQQDLNNDGFVGAHAAPLAAGAPQDAFVFKADTDPVWQSDSNGLKALETFLSATPLPAMIHEALQPLHDLFAAVSADLHLPDGHSQPTVLSDLLSGHFIIH